jgi:nucleoside transporter
MSENNDQSDAQDQTPDSGSPAGDGAAPPLSLGLNAKLSFMMFLQYGIWGAWLPIFYPYLLGHLKLEMIQVGYIFSIGAVGAIVGPFLAGQIADRYFATEKFLALSHFLGAILVWFLASFSTFWPLLAISLVYGLVYAPTLALTNSLSFHHLPDRDRDFGKIRIWGTIGWIAVGIAFGHYLGIFHTPEGVEPAVVTAAQNAARADAFRLSAILGLVMAGFCLMLPHTPPSKGQQKSATVEAFKEIRLQPLITLFLIAIPVSMVHQFYFIHTSSFLTGIQNTAGADKFATMINNVLGVGGGGLMTIGQMTELAVLAAMPILATKLSRKTLLSVGLVAYAARMALFAFAPSIVPVLLGVALHGLCFGCFIFVAFMVVDEECTPDVKATAQNLFNLVIVGLGIIVGSQFATTVVGTWATEKIMKNGEEISQMNYTKLFSVPMYLAIACLLVLLVAYPNKKKVAAA